MDFEKAIRPATLETPRDTPDLEKRESVGFLVWMVQRFSLRYMDGGEIIYNSSIGDSFPLTKGIVLLSNIAGEYDLRIRL